MLGIYFSATLDQAVSYMNSKTAGYNQFQFSYDGNGSGDSVSSMPSALDTRHYYSYNANETFSVTATVPTRSGYTFLGWATSASAVEPQYKAGDSITVSPGSTVLYAVWEKPVAYLTITARNNVPGVSEDQTYLFRIQGNGVDAVVPVTGNSFVDVALPLGSYTVTCLDTWSWRYTCAQRSQAVTMSSTGSQHYLLFSFVEKNNKWVNGFGQS